MSCSFDGALGPEHLADALLRVRQLCEDVPVLAIHWMHVKHRIQPVQDELLDGGGSDEPAGLARWSEGWSRIGRAARGVGYALYVILRLMWLRLQLRSALSALKRQSFTLIAEGWRFPETPAMAPEDFYYSDLQCRLRDRGVPMLLLWKDPDAWGWRMAAGAKSWAVRAQQLPLLVLVPLSAPWRLLWRQFRASRRLWNAALGIGDPWLRRIAIVASRECLSHRIVASSLYYWVTQAAVRTWRPRGVVTLYEGHGWEELAWWGARTADPSCRTLGYQHTMVQHNHKMLRTSGDGLLPQRPDLVLCTGPQAEALLAPSHPRSQLMPFGTFRRSSQDRMPLPPHPERRTVLVLPEAHLDEAILLFQAALDAAREIPDYRFIFRSHPSRCLPFEAVRSHLTMSPDTLPNVELSAAASIREDFARSSVLLYRGSSSVFYAVLHGLKPLYLHTDARRDIDPLSSVSGWRERVSSVAEMRTALERYAATPPECAAQTWKQTAEYADGYVIPVSEGAIDRLAEALTLPRRTQEHALT